MTQPSRLDVLNPDQSLKDPALLLLTGIALGLTQEQIATERRWSPSKVGRWKGTLQEHFGKHILTIMVMLINQNRLKPLRLAGWFDDEYGDRYERTKRHFAAHHLDSRQQQALTEALAQLPATGGWTRKNCPTGVLLLIDSLGLADDGSSLTGLYGLLLATAAENKQLFHTDLPAVITTKVVLKLDNGVTITIEGPPGTEVDEHLWITLPGEPAPAGPAD